MPSSIATARALSIFTVVARIAPSLAPSTTKVYSLQQRAPENTGANPTNENSRSLFSAEVGRLY
eukprot:scaffold113411_cov67-Phaeocystis_antarctica.AAC.1